MATTYRPRDDQRAKELLRERGVSVRELGRQTGVPQSQIVAALNGRITPSRRVYDAVCLALGEELEPSQLFRIDTLMRTKWYPRMLAERVLAERRGGDRHE